MGSADCWALRVVAAPRSAVTNCNAQNGWAQYSTGRMLPCLTVMSCGEIGCRASPLALEAGGKAFRGLAGRSLAHRAGYPEGSAEQLLLRAQRGQPLFVRARNIGNQ